MLTAEEIEKAKYTAYTEAMTRFRWSVLTTTLIASLMGIHVLMERVHPEPDADHIHMLPILEIAVPHRDFVPVLGILLSVFCVIVWMSTGSVLIPLQTLGWTDPEHLHVLQLHLLFLGPQESPYKNRIPIGKYLLRLVIWLPLICYLLLGYQWLDHTPWPKAPFVLCALVTLLFNWLTTARMKQIETTLFPKGGTG